MANLQNRFNQFKANIKISDEKTAQVFVNWKPMQMLSFTISTNKASIQEFILIKKVEDLDRTPSIVSSKVSNFLEHLSLIECHKVKMKSFKIVGNLAKFWINASLNLATATAENPHRIIFRDGSTLETRHGFISKELSIDIAKETVSEAIAKFLSSFTIKDSSPKLELRPAQTQEQSHLNQFNTRVRRILNNIPAPAQAPMKLARKPAQEQEKQHSTRPTNYSKPDIKFLENITKVEVELFSNPIREAYEKALSDEAKYNKEKEKERENYMFRLEAKDFYYKIEEIYKRENYISINNYIFMQDEKTMIFVLARDTGNNDFDKYKDYIITVVNPAHQHQIAEFAVTLDTLNNKDPREAVKLATRLRIDTEIESILNLCKNDDDNFGDLAYELT